MKICYNCFHEGKDQDKHCEYCGYSLIETTDSKYPQALPCGSVLHGEYIVGRVLGQGGFGITYVAQDYNNKQLVAIKEYFPGTTATRTGTRSVQAYNVQNSDDFAFGKSIFLKEATTLSKFAGNQNVVTVYQFFEENGTAYFVMEYVDGESLKNYVRRKGGILQWQEAVDIILPVMDALEAVHKEGIIHRDISPDNIALSKDGTVKLLDFGAARYSMGEKSQSLSVVLKHGFAPAEQYSRHGRQGPWTDVYALGATLYNIITGRMVPDSIDRIHTDMLQLPSSFGIRIPPAVEGVLKKALSVNQEDRFQTMGEFKRALLSAKLPASFGQSSNDPAAVSAGIGRGTVSPGGIGSRTSFPGGTDSGSTGNNPVIGAAGNA
ncbi:MAG: serine/threonine-protein kinase, partial [Eubacteriales bacterium]|nr:serine/threonine-protein kinase [Eubacteriales bacterium]